MKKRILGAAFGAASFGLAGTALAAHHHSSTQHHHSPAKYHMASEKHHAASAKHDAHRHDRPARPSSPPGAANVPAGGIKLYCGPGKSPLMVRKMTQGNGTTVTVICR